MEMTPEKSLLDQPKNKRINVIHLFSWKFPVPKKRSLLELENLSLHLTFFQCKVLTSGNPESSPYSFLATVTAHVEFFHFYTIILAATEIRTMKKLKILKIR